MRLSHDSVQPRFLHLKGKPMHFNAALDSVQARTEMAQIT
jgi:hypothetical protein